jgi:membrane-associated protease RseP (regulator of RpoE activity)
MNEVVEFLKYKMTIEEVTTGIRGARVTGTLNPPVKNTVHEIKEYFKTTEFTPVLSEEKGKHIIHFGFYKKVEDKPKYWLNIVLFLATIVTATFGYYFWVGDLTGGVVFAFSLLAILTSHELGHYFVSRGEGMITSLPYFIPVPFHFIGTFGAVIRMKSLVPSRKSLLKVGMSGPIAGFIVAVPIAIVGIVLSEVRVAPEGVGYLRMGDSLLFYLLTKIIHPNIPMGADIFLHPMAFAGWVGMLVTSINLFPIGQLDGGHVAYSLWLKKRKRLYIPLFAGIILLGTFLWLGWFVWGLLAFYIARRDPVIQDAITPLTKREKLYAIAPLIILILTFIPQPFSQF